jgi:hypothetical protein
MTELLRVKEMLYIQFVWDQIDVHWLEGGGGGERHRRMNVVQIMYKHVCKCKNDTC